MSMEKNSEITKHVNHILKFMDASHKAFCQAKKHYNALLQSKETLEKTINHLHYRANNAVSENRYDKKREIGAYCH